MRKCWHASRALHSAMPLAWNKTARSRAHPPQTYFEHRWHSIVPPRRYHQEVCPFQRGSGPDHDCRQENVAEWYFYLSGFTSATTLDVISLPVENFDRLSLIQFENWGMLTAQRRKMFAATELDHNFVFGLFGFVLPSAGETVTHVIGAANLHHY